MRFFTGNRAHKITLVGFHPESRIDDTVIVLDWDFVRPGLTVIPPT